MKYKRILVGVIIAIILIASVSLFKRNQEAIVVSSNQNLQGKIVVLDPGHGGLDNGASIGNTNEDELNLKICNALKTELEAQGATVYLTRSDDHDMTNRDYLYSKQDDMYLRVRQIDAYKPNYLISIHLNASPSSSAWGSQVFYYNRSEQGKELAQDIHTAMKEVTGTRKKISGSNFMVLRATKTLGVLVECGFLSNANERGQLRNSKYHEKLAVAITSGLVTYNNKHLEDGKEEVKDVLE